ncbi:MAG: hypothetical protein R3Y15_00505 [Rikenellaceae bacterium]
MMEQYSKLEQYFATEYSEKEYPTLSLQRAEWAKTRPLEGLEILDATPLCRNSIYKYMNLIYAGASLSIGQNPSSSTSEQLLELVREAGIELVRNDSTPRDFDIIMDCAAQFMFFGARLGRVELTRSGAELYKESGQRVFMADGGRIKMIETCIGTGEGYFRAMDYLGYNNWQGRTLALFGCGKVGQGIFKAAQTRGVEVVVVSDPALLPDYVVEQAHKVVDYRDRELVTREVLGCYAMVTAIGQRGAVERTLSAAELSTSDVLLANMGAEDEYGDSFAASRILAAKDSLNFILDEPTQLKYIDATLSLHNLGVEYLINNGSAQEVILPPDDMEQQLLNQTLEHGVISKELKELLG